MIRKAALVTLLALATLAPACADPFGVHGVKGNDTGGIIPWSPPAERFALEIARTNCAAFDKYGVISSMRRGYGNYIVYSCRWKRPYWRVRHRAVVSVRG